MPLTRSMLREMGLDEAQISTVIGAHVEVKRALEEQRDALQRQLEALADGPRAELEALRREFDDYRSGIERAAARTARESAYRRLLSEERVPERFHDRILRLTELDALTLEDGRLRDEDAVRAAVRRDWADYIARDRVRGVAVDTPPAARPPARMTPGQIMAIPDDARRQREIARNHELFGF